VHTGGNRGTEIPNAQLIKEGTDYKPPRLSPSFFRGPHTKQRGSTAKVLFFTNLCSKTVLTLTKFKVKRKPNIFSELILKFFKNKVLGVLLKITRDFIRSSSKLTQYLKTAPLPETNLFVK
jgi:hypothetical protein